LLSVVAGEAIHNLRSALDHLAWTLVLNDGGSPDHRRTQFPIWEDRLTPGGELRTVTIKGGIKPETESILEDLQAFHHVNDPTQHSLALLRHLSNIDKHRTLYVTVLAVEKVSAKLFHSGELVAKSQSSGPFRDGELVAFYEHDNPLIVHEINYEFEYKPFLAFGDFRPDFHPSFPDLIGELRDFVQDRVVQRFARARFGGELDFPKPFW
jgi:hypothetical protein